MAVIGTLCAVLAFYGTTYSLHQDLAGGVLTGALAVALGDNFDKYNAYFPPIERFWYVLASDVAGLTGLAATTAVLLQTFLAVVVSAALGYVVRQRTTGAGVGFFLIPMIVFLVLPIAYKNIFGLREHLIILGFWPYLVLRASGESAQKVGVGLRTMVGLWLGCMLLFKFFYSVVVFLIEVADALAKRRVLILFRIENVVAGTVVFIYLLTWFGGDASQGEAALALREAIAANLVSASVAAEKSAQLIGIGVAVWLLLFRFRLAAPGLSAIGLAAVIGAVLVAALQQRFYTHHMFPIFMAFGVWWWLVGASFPKWLHVGIGVLLLYPLQEPFQDTRAYQEETKALEMVLAEQGISFAGKRVALLNQHPSPFNQVIASQGGLRWSPQMNIAYVSTELKPYDIPENRGIVVPPVLINTSGQRLLHSQLISLWEDYPPDIMILDATYQWPLRYLSFEWEQVFSLDEGFQRVTSQFEPVFSEDTPQLKFTYYERSE